MAGVGSGGAMMLGIDAATLAAIVAMSLVTIATRLVGLLFDLRAVRDPRTRAMVEAIPAAVLIAVVAPMILATGVAETIAAAITAIVATRLPLIATVVVGTASAALLRWAIGG
jgi:uncharacterized membrane protein